METSFTSSIPGEPAYEESLRKRPSTKTSPVVRLLAASAMMIIALGLIGLGGCFLIGVLQLVHLQAETPTASPALVSQWASLQQTLYILAYICFGGALILMLLGMWGLLRVLMERFSTT